MPIHAVSDLTVEAITARQRWDLVAPLLRAIKTVKDPSETIAKLRRFVTLLVAWNSNVSNLISKNDVPRIVERHLVESLEPAAVLVERSCRAWLDFGSGAGLPAIPLALVGIGERWVLVESRRPKTLFLRKTLQEISLPGVSVVHDRLENLVVSEPFDGFTARATEAIGPTLHLAALHVRPGGTACLWKGSSWQDELAADQEWKTNWDLEQSIQLDGRHNVIVLFTRK